MSISKEIQTVATISVFFIILLSLSGCSSKVSFSFNNLPSLNHDITINISFNDLANQRAIQKIFTSLQPKSQYQNSIKTEISPYNIKITIFNVRKNENLADRFVLPSYEQRQILSWLSSYRVSGDKNNLTISYNPSLIKLNSSEIFAGSSNYSSQTKKEIVSIINQIYKKKGIKIILFSENFKNSSSEKEQIFRDLVESAPEILGLNTSEYGYLKNLNIGVFPSIIAVNVNKECYFIPKMPLTKEMFDNLKRKCTTESDIIAFTDNIAKKINTIFKSDSYAFLTEKTKSVGINPKILITIKTKNNILAAKSIGKPKIQSQGKENKVTFTSNIIENKGDIVTIAYDKTQSSMILISSIIIITITISIFVIIYVISSKKQTEKKNKTNEQSTTILADYINKNLKSGISIEISKNYLKNAGWPKTIIDKAIYRIKRQTEQQDDKLPEDINKILPNLDKTSRSNLINYIKKSLESKSESEIIRKLDALGWGKYNLKALVKYVKMNR